LIGFAQPMFELPNYRADGKLSREITESRVKNDADSPPRNWNPVCLAICRFFAGLGNVSYSSGKAPAIAFGGPEDPSCLRE